MLISFFANSLISLVILGYSYLFKMEGTDNFRFHINEFEGNIKTAWKV